MPLLIALALATAAILLAIVLMPLTLVQRYRVGTARRQARGWIVTVNLFGVTLSTGIFLFSAAVTNVWVPGAVRYAAFGLCAGAVLGLIGLWLTRWEARPDALHYTPSRVLVLAITLVVTARILYGVWRSWEAWQAAGGGLTWLPAAGIEKSFAAGAVVLGYYLTYWLGVRRRVRRAHVGGTARNARSGRFGQR